MRFLNILFDGKLHVTDVIYHDKEILPSSKEGKRIVYDVYCTYSSPRDASPFFPPSQIKHTKGDANTDHHFILEMQNIYLPPFEERIVFYASKAIASQGKSGWNYELEPVFAIAVTDFNFSHLSPKLMRDVMLVDRETMEPLTDKLHILLCSLKEVPSVWEECETELAQVLFLIKNMEKMDNTSLAYKEGNFTEIFNAARSNTLKDDEIVAYSQSLDKLRDIEAGILFAADEAREKGREEGRAEGRAEGRSEVISEKVVKARELGLPEDIIAQLFGN